MTHKTMLSQKDLDKLEKTFATKFLLKKGLIKMKNELFTKADLILKEIRRSRKIN